MAVKATQASVQGLRPQAIFSQFNQPMMQAQQQPVLPSTPIYGPPDPAIFGGGGPAPGLRGPDPSIFEVPSNAPAVPAGIDPTEAFRQMVEGMNTLYTPSVVDRNRNRDLLDQAPVRQPAGVGTKIAASLAGLKGGFGDAAKVLDYKGDRDLKDWQTKTGPFGAAAQMENVSNNTERQLAGNMITAKTQTDAQASRERVADEKNRITEENNKMRAENERIRARAYAYSQSLGKGWDWDLSGPTAKKINKSTGEVMDTGLETGKMTEETKIELQNEGRIAAARETGANAQARTETAGAQIVQIGGKTYSINPRTNEATEINVPAGVATKPSAPGRAGGGATSQLEKTRVENARMKDLYELTPEARKWITTKDGGKTFTMKPRPEVANYWFADDVSQEDVDAWDELRKEVDPTYTPPGPKGTTPQGAQRVPAGTNLPVPTNELKTKAQAAASVKPNTGQAIPRPAQLPSGMIEITKDGQSGMIPANQEAEAIRQGWKKVR